MKTSTKHRFFVRILFFLLIPYLLTGCNKQDWEITPIQQEAPPGVLDFGQTTSGLQNPPVPVSLEQSKKIFSDMADESDIAFNYPIDGCYARAHIMNKRIEDTYGITPYKIWAFGNLQVDTNSYGKVQWRYHVATLIRVTQDDGTIIDMVIDPSIATEPITVEEWKNKMNDPNAQWKITKPGEAPIPANGGTGYWPGPDPGEDLYQYSIDVMEKYKKCGQNISYYCN